MYFLTNTKDQLWEYFAEFSATKESVLEGIRYLKEWLEQEQYLPKLQGMFKLYFRKYFQAGKTLISWLAICTIKITENSVVL